MNKNIAVVLGTRPEILKLAPVISLLGDRVRLIHTGQHYDETMSDLLLSRAGIGRPDVVLEGIGGASRAEQIGRAILALDPEFRRERPGAVIVQGDTNAVSAGAQLGNYHGIPTLHVEAGLRSRDRRMPEEINRLMAGVLADVHCAATPANVDNLRAEGVDPARIALTGNTIVEATRAALAAARVGPHEFLRGHRTDAPFVVATIHRPENTDTMEALGRIVRAFASSPVPIVFFVHPRTRALLDRFGLTGSLGRVLVHDPCPHEVLLGLASQAALIVSDSGGMQEEATVIGKRILVPRRSTERPEAITAGFARLITPDEDLEAILFEELALPFDRGTSPSPYGDGHASERIAELAVRIADGAAPAEAVAQLADSRSGSFSAVS